MIFDFLYVKNLIYPVQGRQKLVLSLDFPKIILYVLFYLKKSAYGIISESSPSALRSKQ